MNKEIIESIKATKTVDELKEVAAKKGYVLNDEEAKGYFDMYHASGKINDKELDNVAGGLCRNGRTYSTDWHHWLIVTDFNHCDDFENGHFDASDSVSCGTCIHHTQDGYVKYCTHRSFNNDPRNPA